MAARAQPPAELLEPLGGHLRVSALLAILVGTPATLGACGLGAYPVLWSLWSQRSLASDDGTTGCSALAIGLAGLAVLWGAHLVERNRTGDPRSVIRGLSGITLGSLILAIPGLLGVLIAVVGPLVMGASPRVDPLWGLAFVAALAGPLGTAFHATWLMQVLSPGVRAWEANAARDAATAPNGDPPPATGA